MVDGDPSRRRGTTILVLSIIVISSLGLLQSLPPIYPEPELDVRVAIIDSGINIDSELQSRVIAERSFINTSYGYLRTDITTHDSTPNGNLHGTFIAKIIAEESPDVGIINAKVVSDADTATMVGVAEAIRWAVLEENCSVINISLGMGHFDNDVVGDAVKWAVSLGVCVVAAAGNDGDDGIAGSSIDSPGVYDEVIAVAGVDDLLVPYGFSGRGPLRNRVMKPDISAWGYYKENGGTVFGTSFAAPYVCAAAIRIIAHCFENGLSWTPGMIKASLMISAIQLPYEEWEVGAGFINIHSAITYIDNAQKVDNLPLISMLNPTDGPFSFEYWFVNHSVSVPISIFSSSNVTFDLAYRGPHAHWIEGPSEVTVNQTGQVVLEINMVASDDVNDVEAWVTFSAPNYLNMRTSFNFDAKVPYKEIAIDTSHAPWFIDSRFGQFRGLTFRINNLGSSVDEFVLGTQITLDLLSQYDAVLVLDPCAWSYVFANNSVTKSSSYQYSQLEINAYVEYWKQGGSIFLVGLTNESLDVSSANALFSAFNITLNYDIVPPITIVIQGQTSTALIKDMHDHPVTRFLDSFDYYGCSLNISGSTFELAWSQIFLIDEHDTIYQENRTVLAGLENSYGGRLLATGSNFFLDNWALEGMYQSKQNWRLVLQALYWLLHILNT